VHDRAHGDQVIAGDDRQDLEAKPRERRVQVGDADREGLRTAQSASGPVASQFRYRGWISASSSTDPGVSIAWKARRARSA
jgi:hypothetical protein